MSHAILEEEITRSHIARDQLPEKFPTHLHDALFWENLGRTVATFGLLEETLGKAVFALTVVPRYDSEEIAHAAYQAWLQALQHGLGDPLVNLAESYGNTVRDHPDLALEDVGQLVADIRKSVELRNVLCHGSWQTPDESGRSLPLFVDSNQNVFGTPIDIEYLEKVRHHVVDLICGVIESVTQMGWRFPGGFGLGPEIWTSEKREDSW